MGGRQGGGGVGEEGIAIISVDFTFEIASEPKSRSPCLTWTMAGVFRLDSTLSTISRGTPVFTIDTLNQSVP